MSGQVIAFPAYRRSPEPLLTMRDLVDRYQMSERWFRYRVAEGMPSHRWGGSRRFRASEVERWLEARYADARCRDGGSGEGGIVSAACRKGPS